MKELAGFDVKGLASREQSLEELFLHLYGEASSKAEEAYATRRKVR